MGSTGVIWTARRFFVSFSLLRLYQLEYLSDGDM
jgi:hypothetical protein